MSYRFAVLARVNLCERLEQSFRQLIQTPYFFREQAAPWTVEPRTPDTEQGLPRAFRCIAYVLPFAVAFQFRIPSTSMMYSPPTNSNSSFFVS